ncbi:MAG: radical SAM/SPASM domain-containing protein [Candidatus Omnitrophota bacterium]
MKSSKGIAENLVHHFRLVKGYLKNLFLSFCCRLPKIRGLVYEVTDRCNSHCQHCDIWRQTSNHPMLAPQEVSNFLSNRRFSGLRDCLITGGEPVLREDIKELILAINAARPKATITLSTNALLPERVLEVLRFCIEKNIVVNLGVSLDGIGEAHDKIRGVEGNFAKADYLLKEAKQLKGSNPDKVGLITIGFTLSNLTAGNLRAVRDYAEHLRLGFLTQLYEEFPYYHNIVSAKEKNLENYLHSGNDRLIEEVKQLPVNFHNEVLLEALSGRLRLRCDALRGFFLLRCNGDVATCLCQCEKPLGNIKTETFEDIWQGAAAQQARKRVEGCRGCSNSWAAAWSYEVWYPHFWRITLGMYLRKLQRRLQ